MLFYYVESAYNDRFTIKGNHKAYVNGNTYWMKKLVDNKGDTEIVLRCKTIIPKRTNRGPSRKQQCVQSGGHWNWNSNINQWSCD